MLFEVTIMKKILKTAYIFLLLSAATFAAPGDLDLTFNGTGKATVGFGGSAPQARATVVQPDGKIIVAGYATPVASLVFALARYNPDGTLDSSFDGDGLVTTTLAGSHLRAFSVALQSDGKIVAGGVFNGFDSRFAVVRYNANGSLDTSFDTDGIALSPDIGASGSGVMSVLGIQPDGKIVAAGSGFFSGSGYDFCVVRFNPNGSLDTSFDSDGVVNTSISPNWDYGNSIAIQSDGKIVVAGQSRNDTDGWDQIALVRYNTNGSLDSSFDADGILTTVIGTVGARSGSDAANSVAVQSDNKIVVAGRFGHDANFAIVRYNANGSLDTTFDADGKVTTTVGSNSNDRANAVVIQADGKIIAAGSSTSVSGSVDFAVVRYNTDGSLDNSFAAGSTANAFGNGGKVLVDFSGAIDIAYGATLDLFGRLIATGSAGDLFGTLRLQGLAPTAASVTISGRVRTADGRGLSSAIVYLTDIKGNTSTVRTGTFGYYRFEGIEAGQTVVIGVLSKRYRFEPRILSVGEDISDLDLWPIEAGDFK